jgi:5,10-methylenetetrahydrofolate reductase
MLTSGKDWVHIAEVNPPALPDMRHLLLEGAWSHALITDNVFGKIRVSPYAFAARITHDVPAVHPTVVVSTRDRNILAIESEVRGALGNGVNSFLVVIGDTMPAVDHLADHYEIVEHLRHLQQRMPAFEVGMPTRFREWQFRRRIGAGAQFFVAGPVLDPATVAENVGRLGLRDDDPPVFLAVIPPFSPRWVDRSEQLGSVPVTEDLRRELTAVPAQQRRAFAWDAAAEAARRAREAGCAGTVLMGLKFDTVVDEAAAEWRTRLGR